MSSSNPSCVRSKTLAVLRVILRIIWLAVVVALILYGSATLKNALFRLSPLLFLASFLPEAKVLPTDSTDFATVASWCASLAVIAFCVLKKRFFCRYVCPLGCAVDVVAQTRRRLFKTKRGQFGLALSSRPLFRFFLIIWILAVVAPWIPFVDSLLPQGITPFAFDPFALISRWLHTSALSASFILFILCFAVSPYFWRFHFCPCGALQEVLYAPSAFVKRLVKTRPNRHSEQHSSRRDFFAVCASVVAFITLRNHSCKTLTRAKSLVRPPGAKSEIAFLTSCARCNLCAASCPNEIIRASAPLELRDASFLDFRSNLPTIDFNRGKGYCEKNCVQCAEACPTGALLKMRPSDKAHTPIAKAKFTFERCLLYYQQECSICRRECLYNAIEFVWSEEEYEKIPVIDDQKCVGCGRCVVFCPGEPIFNENGEMVEPETATQRIKALEITPLD